MRVGRAFRGLGLALALVLTAPSVALADATLMPSGALVYSWHGDPARGCARVGVCGVQGTLVVDPHGPLFLFGPSPNSRTGQLDLSGSTATVRVRRIEPASAGDCVDANVWPGVGDAGLTLSWRRDGRATAGIPQAGGPSSGRCAGPLSSDLPAQISGRRLAGRRLGFDFAGTVSFAAGPYSGTLQSTLVLRSVASQGGSSQVSEGGSTAPPGRMILDERVAITYRVSAAPGTITAGFHGEFDGFCLALDTCGTSGRASLAFAKHAGTLTVEGDRPVPRRVSRSVALSDLRAGRLSFGLPIGAMARAFSVSETLFRAGGASCTDATAAGPRAITWLGSPFIGRVQTQARSAALPVIVSLVDQNEFLRTHCPGPTGADAFGANEVLARGSLPTAAMLARQASVTLLPPRSFSAVGYAGSLSGGLSLTLTPVRITAGTIRVPA